MLIIARTAVVQTVVIIGISNTCVIW